MSARKKTKPAWNEDNVQADLVRVHRVSNDATQDYCLPRAEAERLYEEGKLSRDLTNGGYCQHNGGHVEPVPPRWARR